MKIFLRGVQFTACGLGVSVIIIAEAGLHPDTSTTEAPLLGGSMPEDKWRGC